MDLYILDPLLRRQEVVDQYESLIWTDRWNSHGDFELDLKSTLANRGRFLIDTKLAIPDSNEVMVVEETEDITDSDGKEILKVKGRTLTAILENRVAKLSMDNLEADPAWVLTGTPGDVVREMFDHICRSPYALSDFDGIPFLQSGTIFDLGNIPEPSEVITVEQRPTSLYDAIRKLCRLYDLGFRLVKNGDTSELYFEVYTGNDRTTRQSVLSAVIFSASLDSVQNTSEFHSSKKAKNVAYVFSNYGSMTVYADDVDPNVSGFDRRAIFVETRPDNSNMAVVNAAMEQAGKEALADARKESLFDGEVNEYAGYIYREDYGLGDLVEMRNRDGVVTYKRVTEHIFVSDQNGDRSYPTLAMDEFAGEVTWLSWANQEHTWSDFTDEVWADF